MAVKREVGVFLHHRLASRQRTLNIFPFIFSISDGVNEKIYGSKLEYLHCGKGIMLPYLLTFPNSTLQLLKVHFLKKG